MEEQFAPNQLGHVTEDKWRQWVDGMNGIGYFVQWAYLITEGITTGESGQKQWSE